MKFTILSHAGMLVEAQGIKLVSDPWILGSSYWRSWWNYPKPASFSKEGTDYIYLTHMHWDHFHGPSLRKFPPSVTFLVPKAPTSCIVDDLKDFKYKQVIELPHGKTTTLAPGLRVTSYQFGLNTDSTLVIEDGRTTLINMNDCKLAGWPLKQLLKRHPHPDFLFRSHSSAQPYPHCIDAEDENDLGFRKNEDYVADFVESARLVQPKFAVPFASNNCFLHRETIQFNREIVSPLDVKSFFDQHKPGKSECVVMVAGDSWDDRDGFHINEQDFFTAREQHLQDYAREVAPVLKDYYSREAKAKVSFQSFESYFKPYLKSLPWFVRLAFKPVIVFEVEGQPDVLWGIDFDKKRVFEATAPFPNYALRFRVPSAVLRDCLQRKMFTLLFPSKRLRVEMKKGRVKDYFIFEQLFDLYEYRLLPVRLSLSARSISAWARRWRELQYMLTLFIRVFLHRRRDTAISELVPRTTL